MNGWVALCAVLGGLLQLPLLLVTVRKSTGVIDGGRADTTYGPDRTTDYAAIGSGVGIGLTILAAVLALL